MSVVLVTYGAGRNSTAAIIGMVARSEPIDAIIFADTGGEKPETYAYLRSFAKWLRPHGHAITRVQRTNLHGTSITLEAECHRTAQLPSIAYGGKTCSEKFKTQPQEKWCNHWQPALDAWKAGAKVTKIVGYSADELRRVENVKPSEKYEHRFPLVEWAWGQEDCEREILAAGLEMPPKSACFFCPSSKRQEIVQLRLKHPDLYQRAIDMEERARPNLRGAKGLGRRFSWAEVDVPGLDTPIDTPCMCFDGEEDAA